jgi:hypothetical protein
MSDHIHDCTGPKGRCHCGYAFLVPPVCVSIEVSVNGKTVLSDGFNCETVEDAVASLRRSLASLERWR